MARQDQWADVLTVRFLDDFRDVIFPQAASLPQPSPAPKPGSNVVYQAVHYQWRDRISFAPDGRFQRVGKPRENDG
eukprot:SAG31_NODE_21493_length_548_cov_0.895323_1_plen_75_part_01